MSGVVQRGIPTGWAAPKVRPMRNRLGRLASALGVERSALTTALGAAQGTLQGLRRLTLSDLLELELRLGDAERIFYLVQWERLQAHLERRGELPESGELESLLRVLIPIFERHFSRGAHLSDALLAYRAEFSGNESGYDPALAPTGLAERARRWLRRAHRSLFGGV